jgi:tetratricopeptide (TPR) repeat protein
LASIANAYAQSAREQLQQLAAQLQKTPNDNALRERLLNLAQEVRPPPAIPEEARRYFVQGNAIAQAAKEPKEQEVAVRAFNKALEIAPWWEDAYYNLAIAYELAGNFDDAIRSLKLYLLAKPGEKQAREAQDRIYAVEGKRQLAAALPVKEERRPSVEGTWSVSGFMDFQVVREGDRFSLRAGKMMSRYGMWRATDAVVDAQHVRFTVEQPACPQCKSSYDLQLSPGGNELTGTLSRVDGSRETAANITRMP